LSIKVRNITGSVEKWIIMEAAGSSTGFNGAFYTSASYGAAASNAGNHAGRYLYLNANADTSSYGNPMYRHASGSDIHPYNIKMLPLIAY